MFYDGTHKYNGLWPAFLTYLTYFTPNTADCSSFYFSFFHFFCWLTAHVLQVANASKLMAYQANQNVGIQGTVVFYSSRR